MSKLHDTISLTLKIKFHVKTRIILNQNFGVRRCPVILLSLSFKNKLVGLYAKTHFEVHSTPDYEQEATRRTYNNLFSYFNIKTMYKPNVSVFFLKLNLFVL